jgi:ribosomal protein L7/L12
MTSTFATVLGFSDFAIIAWLMIVFTGAAAYAMRKSAETQRIERKLDALLKHHGITLPPQAKLSEEVQRLARDPAQRSNAVMLHRTETGLGLAEAKADIEDFIKTIQ